MVNGKGGEQVNYFYKKLHIWRVYIYISIFDRVLNAPLKMFQKQEILGQNMIDNMKFFALFGTIFTI